jgi:hypothetical protein
VKARARDEKTDARAELEASVDAHVRIARELLRETVS